MVYILWIKSPSVQHQANRFQHSYFLTLNCVDIAAVFINRSFKDFHKIQNIYLSILNFSSVLCSQSQKLDFLSIRLHPLAKELAKMNILLYPSQPFLFSLSLIVCLPSKPSNFIKFQIYLIVKGCKDLSKKFLKFVNLILCCVK